MGAVFANIVSFRFLTEELGPSDGQHEKRAMLRAPEGVLDPALRLAVGPLHVFEYEYARPAARRVNDEFGHRQPELVAGAALIAPLGQCFVGDEARQELLCRRRFARSVARGRHGFGERAAGSFESRALRRSEQRAHDVGGKPERMTRARTSRTKRLLPIPGAPMTETTTGVFSSTHRS